MNSFELNSGLFSADAEMILNGRAFGRLHFGFDWKKLGTIHLVDKEYTVSKATVFSSGLRLVDRATVIAEAQIHEVIDRLTYFDFNGTWYKAEWLSGTKVHLAKSGSEMGSIELVESLPKKWRASLPDTLPVMVCAFFFWVVLFDTVDRDRAHND